jgi:hypothetical protein
LRKFDDRYAGAAADIRAALDQTRASLKAVATSTDLKPITASLANMNAELATLTTRVDGLASSLQARDGNLERTIADALAVRPGAATPAPAVDRLGDAFTAILATPPQTLPLRAWLETHPDDPQAAEALFQLGLALLDSGYPSAGRHYFRRLIDGYGTSLQAAEAKALLDSSGKPTPRPTRKRRSEAPARVSQTACDPMCRPAVAIPPPEMPLAQPSKPAPAASATTAPPPGGGRLTPSRTRLQPAAADRTPPGGSPLIPAVGEVK